MTSKLYKKFILFYIFFVNQALLVYLFLNEEPYF